MWLRKGIKPAIQILQDKVGNSVRQIATNPNCIQQIQMAFQNFSCISLLKHLGKRSIVWILEFQITKSGKAIPVRVKVRTTKRRGKKQLETNVADP